MMNLHHNTWKCSETIIFIHTRHRSFEYNTYFSFTIKFIFFPNGTDGALFTHAFIFSPKRRRIIKRVDNIVNCTPREKEHEWIQIPDNPTSFSERKERILCRSLNWLMLSRGFKNQFLEIECAFSSIS